MIRQQQSPPTLQCACASCCSLNGRHIDLLGYGFVYQSFIKSFSVIGLMRNECHTTIGPHVNADSIGWCRRRSLVLFKSGKKYLNYMTSSRLIQSGPGFCFLKFGGSPWSACFVWCRLRTFYLFVELEDSFPSMKVSPIASLRASYFRRGTPTGYNLAPVGSSLSPPSIHGSPRVAYPSKDSLSKVSQLSALFVSFSRNANPSPQASQCQCGISEVPHTSQSSHTHYTSWCCTAVHSSSFSLQKCYSLWRILWGYLNHTTWWASMLCICSLLCDHNIHANPWASYGLSSILRCISLAFFSPEVPIHPRGGRDLLQESGASSCCLLWVYPCPSLIILLPDTYWRGGIWTSES